MRRTVSRKKGEDRVTLNLQIPVSVDAKLRDYTDAHEKTLTEVVIEGIETVVEGEEKDIASPDCVSFKIDEEDRARLQKLADGLFIGDVNLTARIVSLRLASLDIEDARALLLTGGTRLRDKLAARQKPKKTEDDGENGIRKVA